VLFPTDAGDVFHKAELRQAAAKQLDKAWCETYKNKPGNEDRAVARHRRKKRESAKKLAIRWKGVLENKRSMGRPNVS